MYYRLEATGSATLQLRTTASGLLNYGITHPTSCGSGTSGVGQVFRFSSAIGETLSAPLCDLGSTMFINVYDFSGSQTHWFRCWRATSNHNMCQRILP